jgi:hypothetical protein
MINTVSLKKIGTPAVAKVAGLFVLAALAMAFFAFPMVSLAMGGCGVKPQLVQRFTVVQGYNQATDNSGKVVFHPFPAGHVPAVKLGSYIDAFYNNKDWAATVTKLNSDGTPKTGIVALDNGKAGTPLKF